MIDDMSSILIMRLEEEGRLDDTVIIAYADHYSYGITNQDEVLEYSVKKESDILERMSAFIWYKGREYVAIDKVCQVIDWLPTTSNMLVIDIMSYVL